MTIAKIEWKLIRKSFLIWFVLLTFLIFLFMSMFPSMQNLGMKETLDSTINALPKAMLQAFHLDSSLSLSSPIGYFAYVMQYLFIAVCIFAMLQGSTSLIKEESAHTIEFLYAQPVSRKKIVYQKLFLNLVLLIIFWLALFIVTLGVIGLFDSTNTAFSEISTALGKVYLKEFIVLLFFLSIGFLFSSLLKKSQQGMNLSMGVVFMLYILGIAGELQPKIKLLKEWSPVNQGIPMNILQGDDNALYWLVLFALSVIGIVLSVEIYQRKDFQI